MIIRQLEKKDFDAVHDVWRRAGMTVRPEGRESRVAFEQQLEAFGPIMLAAEIDGGIAGVVLGSHDTRKGWGNRLAVVPEHRGKGIARALAEKLESELIKLGIEVFTALIMEDNAASRRLAESAGYECWDDVKYYSKRLRTDA
jgi:ribosomal protein S18 acetylase RimI-like enzyme